MFRPLLICGRSFKVQQDDEFTHSPCSKQQRRSTKTCKLSSSSSSSSSNRRSRKTSKNPYANRGLDKFSELLANIEEKKQRIYLSKNSRNISFVRFVYSNSSDDVVPIVVKKTQVKFSEELKREKPTPPVSVATPESCLAAEKVTKKVIILENLKHPSCYVPVFTVLILLMLAVFGRSAAILLTSIGWYLVPIITGDTLKAKVKQGKKKGYIRKLNENNNNTIAIDGLKKKELLRKFSEIQMAATPEIQNNIGRTPIKKDSVHRKSF